MVISIRDRNIKQSASHNDLFEACVIREASGKECDDDCLTYYWQRDEKIHLTDQALVGLNVNEVNWLYWPIDNHGPIPINEFEEMYFKLKIYMCDDNIFIFGSGCTESSRQKCSRLIFVWTHGGRGINFLDGHGINLNVSFLSI